MTDRLRFSPGPKRGARQRQARQLRRLVEVANRRRRSQPRDAARPRRASRVARRRRRHAAQQSGEQPAQEAIAGAGRVDDSPGGLVIATSTNSPGVGLSIAPRLPSFTPTSPRGAGARDTPR